MRLSTIPTFSCLTGLAAVAIVGGTPAVLAQSSNAPPPAVVVAPVKNEDITQRAQYVGYVEAIQQTDIEARVEGFIEAVDFTEGSHVSTGDKLFTLDKGTYQAALASAEAELQSGQASLAGAKATLQAADLNLERQKTLVKSNTVSQATVDDAQASRDADAAQVQQAEASISSAKADIETAQLNLSYTDIVSPIDGRIGKALYTKGNLVDTSSGTLATVVQMDPIRVVFSVPDRDYIQVLETTKDMPDEAVRKEFAPSIVLPTGKDYEFPGTISFVDNTVDSSTGTIAIRADFKNPHDILVPGQFVTVNVKIGQTKVAPVVPQSAVLEDKDGNYVLTLDSNDRVQITRIRTGITVGQDIEVTDGLVQGDTIITEGIQRVQPGIVVKPTTAPASSDSGSQGGGAQTGGSQESGSQTGAAQSSDTQAGDTQSSASPSDSAPSDDTQTDASQTDSSQSGSGG